MNFKSTFHVNSNKHTATHITHTHTLFSTVPSTFLSLSLTRFLIAFLGSPLSEKRSSKGG